MDEWQLKYTKLAEELIALKKISLPITTIDGLRTECSLRLDHGHPNSREKTLIVFEAQSAYWGHDLSRMASFTSEFKNPIDITLITEQIKDIFLKIGNLKYDMGSTLVICPFNRHEYIYDICSLPNTTVPANKCCVCLDMTTSKTACKHALCLRCWTNLPDIDGEFTGEGYTDRDDIPIGKSCPVCRIFMRHNRD
jgi:hypothetical protein